MDQEVREYLEDTLMEVKDLERGEGELRRELEELKGRVERLERLIGEGAQFLRHLLGFLPGGEGEKGGEEERETPPPERGEMERLRGELERERRERKRLEEQLELCRREKQEIELERQELREGLARLNRELKPVIEELERENRELKEERKLLIARLEGAKEEIAELQQLRSQLEEELERVERQRDQLIRRVEELELELEKVEERCEEQLRGVQGRIKEWRRLLLPLEKLEQLLQQLSPSYRERLGVKGDKLTKFAWGIRNYPLLWERAFELLKREGAKSPDFLTMREILELLFPYYQQIENLEKVVPAKGAPFVGSWMNRAPDSPKEGVVEETQLFGFKKRHSSELLRRPVVKLERG
jgi:DNA repair exonuclease SbcCD ATPase subunit